MLDRDEVDDLLKTGQIQLSIHKLANAIEDLEDKIETLEKGRGWRKVEKMGGNADGK